MSNQITPIIKPSPSQHQAWQILQDKDTNWLLFGGGAGGGKSWLGCEWLLTNCYFFPNTRWFIGREELKRLRDSTLVTWYKVCSYHNIPSQDWKYNGQDHYIEFVQGSAKGSRIDLLDLKFLPTDPMYERYGSVEYTGGWIEEAGEVNFGAFDTLKSRIGRQLNDKYGLNPAKLLITCNPKKNWLYRMFYKPWVEKGTTKWQDGLGNGYAFIQALVDDNPYQESNYRKNLLSLSDNIQKQRLLFGNWEYDDDPTALMRFDTISDMFTNSLLGDKSKSLTVDVARFGEDKTVFMYWEGLEVKQIKEYTKQGTNTTIELIRQYAKDHQIPYSQIVIDEDGVGGGVVDGLSGCRGFIGNHSAEEIFGARPNYRNLRSQCYFMLADRVNTRKIAVNATPQQKDLITEELEQIKAVAVDKDTTQQIIPKDEIKEVIGRSPDYADALMMRMLLELGGTMSDQTIAQQEQENNQFDTNKLFSL